MSATPTFLKPIERWRFNMILAENEALRRENRCLRLLHASARDIGKETFLQLDNIRVAVESLRYGAEANSADGEKWANLASPIESERGALQAKVLPCVVVFPIT